MIYKNSEDYKRLKQKYLDQINQYGFSQYHYVYHQTLSNFSIFSKFANSIDDFPLRTVLQNIMKNLMMNQIECLHLLDMLESDRLYDKQETVRCYIDDFDNTMMIHDDYRLVYVYILFLAFQVKYHLNDISEIQVLSIFIQESICSSLDVFLDHFSQWKQQIQTLISYDAFNTNQIYKKYSHNQNQNQWFKYPSYDQIVQQIKVLTPHSNEQKWTQNIIKKVEVEVEVESESIFMNDDLDLYYDQNIEQLDRIDQEQNGLEQQQLIQIWD